MTENEIKKLIKKYLNGTISKREEALLEQFDSNLLKKNEKEALKGLSYKKHAKQHLLKGGNGQPKQSSWFKWAKIAASLAILIGAGYLSYTTLVKNETDVPVVAQIVKTTEWGQKINLTLADGTKIQLNSGSTIEFPDKFTGNTRQIKLVGEAFFDVAKNPDKPFIIKSGVVETTVLGTSFNVNTYPDNKDITVTVASGKVKITSKENEIFLLPNEQGIFDKESNKISKEEIDITGFLQWKDGIIHFDDTTLEEVAESLERWYGVSFVFENETVKQCHLTATYDNEALAAVLESIVYTKKGLEYEIMKDHKILIKGKCTD